MAKAHSTKGKRGYGWVPDLPDARDHLYAAPIETVQNLPTIVDLRKSCPPVYDQGQLGSCTANAIGGAVQFDQIKQKLKATFVPSRLFIYYNERVIEGSVSSDAGAQIRDGIKTINQQGVCPETEWPYDIAKFATKPPGACYTAAATHKAVAYKRVTRTLSQMQGCLAAGYPWVFGFTVYESFESAAVAKSGVVPMPKSSESVLGGHAVGAFGYDATKQVFICRNSWGSSWGQKGYFTIPFAYLLDSSLSDDFWTVTTVE